jgi:hypothetical protein
METIKMRIAESEPMGLFLYGIKSPITKDRYLKRLDHFFNFLGLSGTMDEKASLLISQIKDHDSSWMTTKIISYIQYHKERAERGDLSDATVRNYYKPIKLFFEMNEITLPWKKITRGLPRGRKFATDRAPTIQEIQKLTEYPDRRIKAIVYIMCSSGIRLGAWDYLKWKHVTPIEQEGKIVAARLLVYAGDPEQYVTFISAEAYSELKKWMDFRIESGENITGDSWLMRDLWNIEKFARGMITVPKQLKSSGLKRLIERALYAQGIRKSLPAGQRRHEFQTDHGFRKFFKTHAEQTMKPINVEIMMGHSTGISDSYYRPSENAMLEDYLKAIPDLTISSEHRQNLTVMQQEEIISELESNQKEIDRLKEGLNIIGLMLAEEQIKNNIWANLENPSHHHTTEQIIKLKEFCKIEHIPEAWQALLNLRKRTTNPLSGN